MAEINLIWTPTAWSEYVSWQVEDKKTLKRINELIKSIERDGVLEGIGKPEGLKETLINSAAHLGAS